MVPIREALAQVFDKDDRVRILHVELRAGEVLLPASQRPLTSSSGEALRVQNNVTVVKLFLRTTGPAPEAPHPTAGTDIGMEIWLPTETAWNNRIRVQIQVGFAGDFRITSKDRFSMAVCSDLKSGQLAADLGYVISSTDGGHIADSYENTCCLLNSDGTPNREGWKNIAWQATHILGVKTKELVTAYYGCPARYSYLYGC